MYIINFFQYFGDNATSSSSYAPFGLFAQFDRYEKQLWMEQNWTVAIYWVAAYLLFIYFGQEYMKNRKPFELKTPMTLWNGLLALFSITACFTTIPEMYTILVGPQGWHKSVCAPW